MQIYAVFLPSGFSPPRAAEEAVFVPQGFDWKAFLATPFWALRHGLWLALAFWLIWIVLAAAIAALARLEPAATVILYGLGALAFGLEADRLRQARLTQSGYLLQGLTLGETVGDAEDLYFDRRVAPSASLAPRGAASPVVASADRAPSPASNVGADLLGLFPPQEHKN
jgi:hypothetical protein